MVGESVGHDDGRKTRACQGIADFEVVLTKAHRYLPCSTPRRRRIIAERIIGPLRHFMRHHGRVAAPHPEEPRGVELQRRISLERYSARAAVISEEAATEKRCERLHTSDDVMKQEYRERVRADTLTGYRGQETCLN